MTRAPATFDPCGPLPQGTTVLEASAGTGKTHTIAGLAVRYLAEGVTRVDELMLVTFGRAATVELRERVRERLVAAASALEHPGLARGSGDDLPRHLAAGTDAQVDVRRQLLAAAVANFDAATIATTHGFCSQMLAGLGIAADVDAEATFAESTDDLVTDVVTDLYVRDYGNSDSSDPPVAFPVAARVAATAVADSAARLEPVDALADSESGVRLRLAQQARAVVAERKRARRVLDYDDLLVRLRDALADPQTGEDACARLRARYRVVLVDEFQDTDPVQWEILERAFRGHRTLVLIGDPKQAIYAFRGADVVTYLLATEACDAAATLATNWRSDQALVEALRQVTGGVALGDPRILVHSVAAQNTGRTLVGAPVDAPVRVRVVGRADFNADARKLIGVDAVRGFVARDVADDVVRLLESGAEVVQPPRRRAVAPGDVAVLVHRNEDARTVRDAVAAAGVPVVLLGTTSVFGSAAALEWLDLLNALGSQHRPGLTRAAALTDFVGWNAERLATASDEHLDDLTARLREWASILTGRGVAALLETIVAGSALTERVLARVDGERRLTDLRHVGQALHAAATETHAGPASLVAWLRRRMAEANDDPEEERSRRLESEAKAVQVLTVHRSKGLEFPVVYAPFLWDRWVPTSPDPLRLHGDDGARILDVGGPQGPGYDGRKAAHLREDAGESLRLAYVALTRARSQVVTHWAPTSNTACGPLHRMLFGRRADDGTLPEKVPVPTDADARIRLQAVATAAADRIRIERAEPGNGDRRPRAAPHHPEQSVRGFQRRLDTTWTRTSYTGLTAGLHDLPGHRQETSEPETPDITDEPTVPFPRTEVPASGEPVGADSAAVSPMARLPGGPAFGTLVHAVLEAVDYTDPHLRERLTGAALAAGSQHLLGVPAADLAEALLPPLHTPLGPRAGGRRLADIRAADRLDELAFELPLAGGDTPTGEVTVAEIATLLRRHLPAGDPLAGYADDLAVAPLTSRRLRGFLAGSIDTVLRVRGADGVPGYVVVDYKTNRLGGDAARMAWRGDAAPMAWHYRPSALARAMRDAHYPLQALLYSVAVHRYLRWRQPGYRPDTHLSGVLYLFLRGMCGPDTPRGGGTPSGVFSWAPPSALVEDLSDLLDGGHR